MTSARPPSDEEECCVVVYSDCCPERETVVDTGHKICCLVGCLGGLVGAYFLVTTEDLFDFFTERFKNSVVGGGVGVTLLVIGFGCAGGIIGKYCFGAGAANICHDVSEYSFNLVKKVINNCYLFFPRENKDANPSNLPQPVAQGNNLRQIQMLYTNQEIGNNPPPLPITVKEEEADSKEELTIKEEIVPATEKQNSPPRLNLLWLPKNKKNTAEHTEPDQKKMNKRSLNTAI
jgi:hypothetical protein